MGNIALLEAKKLGLKKVGFSKVTYCVVINTKTYSKMLEYVSRGPKWAS